MKKRMKSILVVVCIAIFCTIAISGIIAEFGSGDFLSVNTITQTTTLGNTTTYVITINNVGSETDTFNLSAINIDNVSTTSLSQSTLILDAGQSGEVLLNVTDELIPGPYCVLVNVTSQATGLTGEVETITAIVEE